MSVIFVVDTQSAMASKMGDVYNFIETIVNENGEGIVDRYALAEFSVAKEDDPVNVTKHADFGEDYSTFLSKANKALVSREAFKTIANPEGIPNGLSASSAKGKSHILIIAPAPPFQIGATNRDLRYVLHPSTRGFWVQNTSRIQQYKRVTPSGVSLVCRPGDAGFEEDPRGVSR